MQIVVGAFVLSLFAGVIAMGWHAWLDARPLIRRALDGDVLVSDHRQRATVERWFKDGHQDATPSLFAAG